jgi:hypothetical protein
MQLIQGSALRGCAEFSVSEEAHGNFVDRGVKGSVGVWESAGNAETEVAYALYLECPALGEQVFSGGSYARYDPFSLAFVDVQHFTEHFNEVVLVKAFGLGNNGVIAGRAGSQFVLRKIVINHDYLLDIKICLSRKALKPQLTMFNDALKLLV